MSWHSMHSVTCFSSHLYVKAACMYRIAADLVSSRRRADREIAGVNIEYLLSVPECSVEMKWEVLYLQGVRLMNLARNR